MLNVLKKNLPVIVTLLLMGTSSCNKEYDCRNVQLQPVFVGFSTNEIDTFIIRKYSAGNGFRRVIDSLLVTGEYSYYRIGNDSTTVAINNSTNDGTAGIQPDFDWQLYIPATAQTFSITNIAREQKKGHCGGMDKFTCTCTNRNFSAQVNQQPVVFSNAVADSGQYFITIRR